MNALAGGLRHALFILEACATTASQSYPLSRGKRWRWGVPCLIRERGKLVAQDKPGEVTTPVAE